MKRHEKTSNAVIRKLLRTTTKQVKANLRQFYGYALPYEIDNGRAWYIEAHHLAKRFADRYFLASTAHAAGVIAALSPSCAWETNVEDAERVCAARAGEFVRVSTYGPNLAKAIEIRDGAAPVKVLGGKKVTAFYECIENPYTCDRAVIDRHAFCAALDVVVDAKTISQALGLSGVFEWLEQCYQEVAAELGMRPHQLQSVVWLVFRRIKGDHHQLNLTWQ
jgi:hypothetical protein